MQKIAAKYKSIPVQVRASFWFLICSFLQKGIAFITTPIFTRLMSTTEYGNYSVFTSWYNIAVVVVSLNLSWGMFAQGLVKFEDDRPKYCASLQGLSLVLVIMWLVIYVIFRERFNALLSLSTPEMICMLLMVATSAIFGFWSSEQRCEYKYRALVIVTLAASFLKQVIGIILITKMQDKVFARILGMTVVEVFMYGGMLIAHLKRSHVFLCSKYWGYSLKLNIPLIPHYLSLTILNSSDRIMISSMVGESEAGIYSVAYSIAIIMNIANSAINSTLTPWIYKKIKAGDETDIKRIAVPFMCIIGVVNLALIAVAPEILGIFAPAAYREAIWVIPPIAISSFFIFMYDLFASFEFYYEKTSFIMIASMASAALNIILNLIFINLFGYFAAGYTTLACYILYAAGHYCFMRKTCRESNGKEVFSIKMIVSLSILVVILTFLFTISYKMILLRIVLITSIVILAISFKTRIIEIAKEIRTKE